MNIHSAFTPLAEQKSIQLTTTIGPAAQGPWTQSRNERAYLQAIGDNLW